MRRATLLGFVALVSASALPAHAELTVREAPYDGARVCYTGALGNACATDQDASDPVHLLAARAKETGDLAVGDAGISAEQRVTITAAGALIRYTPQATGTLYFDAAFAGTFDMACLRVETGTPAATAGSQCFTPDVPFVPSLRVGVVAGVQYSLIAELPWTATRPYGLPAAARVVRMRYETT